MITPQPPPTKSDSPAVWPLIIAELRTLGGEHDRLADVIETPGTALVLETGRAPLEAALHDALRSMAYARQHYERVKDSGNAGRLQTAWNLHMQAVHLARFVLSEVERERAGT